MLVVLIWLGFMTALYFAPTIFAFSRDHKQKDAIGIVNLFLGWTFIGWVIAFAWASMNK